MSDAKAPGQDIFNFNLCSQCLQPFLGSETQDARHAVPCGHVFCKGCVGKTDAEQKTGKAVCRRPGCGQELAASPEFPASRVPQRVERLRTELEDRFRDQGDAGDSREHTLDTAVAARVCPQQKLRCGVVEAATHRPMCSQSQAEAEAKADIQSFDEANAALESSNAAFTAAVAWRKSELAESTFIPEEFCNSVHKWGAEETTRIRVWEEREVEHIHAVANETVQLVQQVCARRIEVGASVLTQRAGLRASLEEFDQALADLPSDPAAHLSSKRSVHTERRQLWELLARGKIAVPSAQKILKWAELPALSAEFDQKGACNGGLLASAVSTAAKALLRRTLASTPNSTSNEYPVLPALDAAKGLRSILVGKKPNVFVGLDDDTAVIGFNDLRSLQVWDLVAGKLVREFDGKGHHCTSIATLNEGGIAAGWHNGNLFVVAVFDVNSGKRLQELYGFGSHIVGLALVEGHLLTMSQEKYLRVWSQDPAGKFTETARLATSGTPVGMMTVLSSSTVAMSMCTPAQIEIWDWKAGKCVRTLTGFGDFFVFANALLPDGRLLAGDWTGTIRVGLLDNWGAATTISNGNSGLIGALAGHDGSFVTTDRARKIKLWRNGLCYLELHGCCNDTYYGVPLGVIGRRLLFVADDSLLVAE